MLKVTNNFVLHVNSSCDVHGVRTTTVRDVTMMYCKEPYMENVPKKVNAVFIIGSGMQLMTQQSRDTLSLSYPMQLTFVTHTH